MPNLNFPCNGCRKVIAVSDAFKGKAVRCPHCKQVMTAPAAAGTPAAAPAVTVPAAPRPDLQDGPDSIFGEQISEDLFGASPKPSVQVPPAPPPSPGLEATVFQVPGAGGPAPAPSGGTVQLPGSMPDPVPMPMPEGAGAPIGLRRQGVSWDSSTVLISALLVVLAWAIIATILAIMNAVSSQPHPLEMLPDDGLPGARRNTAAIRTKTRFNARHPLPDQLFVRLGETRQFGQLEVTPTKVEQKRIKYKFRTGGIQEEESREDALVLHLHLKNISDNVRFRPTDPQFDHSWKHNKHPMNRLPYTHLRVGGSYYCSPIKFDQWANRLNAPDKDNLLKEYVEGQEADTKILDPGQEIDTVIVTDPKDRVPYHLNEQADPLVWRVQLRRGLVEYNGKTSSRTVVIGVEFDKDQIEK